MPPAVHKSGLTASSATTRSGVASIRRTPISPGKSGAIICCIASRDSMFPWPEYECGTPSLAPAGRPCRHRLQVLVQRLGVDVVQLAKRFEGHDPDGRTVGPLARAQHGDELGRARIAAHHRALARRDI